MAHSQMNVVKFYQSVIDDVISGVRENFLDEGMDEQVLQELKQLWETKVLSSKAVEVGPDNSEPQPPQLLMTKGNGVSLGMVAKTVAMPGQTQILTPVTTSMHNANNSQLHLQQHHQTQQLQQQQQQSHQQQQQSHQQQQHHHHHQQTLQQQLLHQQTQQANAPQQPTQQTVIVADPNKTVPVQITLPAPAGTVTIHVPVSALQGNTLQASLTGPVITAAMALPPPVATTLLQQHVLAALQAAQQQQQQQQSQQQQQAAIQQIPRQTDGQDDSDSPGQRTTEVILQLDGHNDTSDEEDEDVDDDGDDDDEDETEDRVDDDENEDEANGGGQEEEPLNSGDDVSEDDPTDLFDTDNVIVCQYDKITRSRNKWKFYLKDGIMNLNGKDFVFQKSNGDAEW